MCINQKILLKLYLICKDPYIKQQYTKQSLKVCLNKKYRASILRIHINSKLLCKILDKAIKKNSYLQVKHIIKLINYSLFRDEKQLPIFMKHFAKFSSNDHDKMHRALLIEETRLNIWLLIKLNAQALREGTSAKFLKKLCYRISSKQLRLIFDPHMYQHLFLMIRNHQKASRVLQVMNHYLIFHHKDATYRVLYNSCDSTHIMKKLVPISNTIVDDVKRNRFVALCIDLKILKGEILKLAKRYSYCLTDNFYVLAHRLISSRSKQYFNKDTSKSIIRQIEQYNIFLLCLQPSLLLKYGTLTQMQKFLADLPRKNKYFCHIGVRFSLDSPANTLPYSRTVASLYSFIKYVKEKRCTILSNMITNRLV